MRTTGPSLFTLFAVVALWGCWHASGDAGAPAEPDGSDPQSQADLLEAFCRERAEIECAGAEACCATGWEESWPELCRASALDDCLFESRHVLEGHVAVSPERIDACRATLLEHYAACPVFSVASEEAYEPWRALDEDCAVLDGLLGEEEDCDLTAECAGGLLCRYRYADVFREGSKCLSPAADGAACFQDWDCAEGLRCLGNLCRPPREHGENCHLTDAGFDDCDFGFFCPDGVCEPLHPLGDGCVSDEECEGAFWFTECREGLCAERADLAEMQYCWDRDGEDAQ